MDCGRQGGADTVEDQIFCIDLWRSWPAGLSGDARMMGGWVAAMAPRLTFQHAAGMGAHKLG